MIAVVLTKISSSYAEGYVYASDLTDNQLLALGFDDIYKVQKIECTVDFHTVGLSSITLVQVDSICLWNEAVDLEITDLIDASEIEHEIEAEYFGVIADDDEHDSNWGEVEDYGQGDFHE